MSMIVNPFGVAPTGPTDPLFSQVMALLSFDGTNGAPLSNVVNLASHGTSFAYVSGTPSGTITTTTPQSGTACGDFVAGGQSPITSTHADYVVGTNQFTIEVSYWATTNQDVYALDVGDTSGETIRFDPSGGGGAGRHWWEMSHGFNIIPGAPGLLTLNAWNSVALSRGPSNAMFAHLNGVNISTGTSITNSFTGNRITIGKSITGGFPAVCRFDNFRLTIGAARYGSSNYTTTFPFPTS